jgi:glycosyltransferase involved in cell wall biosynthesis
VSHTAPPQESGGAPRIAGFTRHLPEFGWRPAVVTSRYAGDGAVERAPTWRPTEPVVPYERRRRATGSGQAAARRPGERHWLKQLVFQHLAVPDLHAAWVPGAALTAARAVRSLQANALLSSSPSESSHLAAAIAHAITGVPWVADFRDGWVTDSLRGIENRPVRFRIESVLERIVARTADGLVGATRPIAMDLSQRFGHATWIPNGFDDVALPDEAWAEARTLLEPGAFNLVYTGSFRRSRATQSPDTLLEGIQQAGPDGDGRPLRLTVVGRLDRDEAELLSAAPQVTVVEPRPRPVALALQQLADALVLVTAPGEPTVATGKLYEYLGAGRPIVALAEGNEAASLLRELGAGVVVPPDDVGAVADAIRRIRQGDAPVADREDPAIAAFHRRALTGRLAALLDRVAA